MTGLAAHAWRGLWRDNPALVQLLGLCPLLAVSTSTVNGLALGMATATALVVSSVGVSLTRRWIGADVRLPAYVLILATAVTVVDLLAEAWLTALHARLGIFVPLIVTNCAVLARAESYASRHAWPDALADAVFMGLGFALVLTIIGALRELLGHGTVLAGAQLLFGDAADGWTVHLLDGPGVVLAVLPPGAFLTLAALAMARNAVHRRGAGRPQ